MLKEFYALLHGDYADALKRFGTEARLEKYLFKFLADTSFSDLRAALEQQDTEVALRAAHSLKGTSRLLGLVNLGMVSETLERALHNAQSADLPFLLLQTQTEYVRTVSAIHSLQASIEGQPEPNR